MPGATIETNKPEDIKEDSTTQALREIDELNKSFANYQEVARPAIKALIGEWNDEINATKERRDLRKIKIDATKERDNGVFDADEAFIPQRLIQSLINKEVAKHAAYLTKSPRSVILSCNEDASIDGASIEKDFTTKARFNGWEMPLLKWMDGVECHAWDFVETVFDENKPGHFSIEHCGHDNLLFPSNTKNIQAADFLVRFVEYTNSDLARLVKTAGFNAAEVYKLMCAANASNTNANKTSGDPSVRRYDLNRIEKVFFKNPDDGFVYVAWSCEAHCDNWLREPRKLFLGQVELNVDPVTQQQEYIQLFETAYPIDIDVYSIDEDSCIKQLQGAVDLNKDKQEAATTIMSSACTMMKRAANTYWGLGDKENSGVEWDEAQTDIKVEPNRVFKWNLKAHTMPAPDAAVFGVVQMIQGQAQQESGDINYAVQSNKSTRKTSAEVKLAKADNDMLSTTQVTLRSIAYRNVYTRCFDLYRSRVLAGIIIVPQNVFDLLQKYSWTVKPAGDVDVVERQQKVNTMLQMAQFYLQSGARNVFIKKLTKLLFPDEEQEFIQALEESETTNKVLGGLMQVLQGLIADAQAGEPYLVNKLPQLMQLLQATQGALVENGAQAQQEQPSNITKMPKAEPKQLEQQSAINV